MVLQSSTYTSVAAENTTLTYGSSVRLDISAVSANAAYVNLSSSLIYTAYIYGGDLNDGLSIQLFPQYSELHPSLPNTFLSRSTRSQQEPAPACLPQRPC